MSEVTQTPEELVETIHMRVEGSSVIPVPVDPTLSNEGEAADAKATGDAIAAVLNGAEVNGKAFVNKKAVIYAGDIKMSDAPGAQSVAEAINSGDKDASQIIYSGLTTVKDALDDVYDQMDTELTEEEIDGIFDEVFGGDE